MLARLRAEDGIALPMVVSGLFLIALLSITTFQLSLGANSSANRDVSQKRALSAAEAGIQLGTRAMTDSRPGTAQCARDSGGSTLVTELVGANATPDCDWSAWRSLGNGARTRWLVATNTSGACPTVDFVAVGDRCVTAQGEVDGVSRRLVARVNQRPGFSAFATAGLVTDRGVVTVSSNTLSTPIQTNGGFTAGTSCTVTGAVYVGEDAGQSACGRTTQQLDPLLTFPPVDWEEAETLSSPAKLSSYFGTSYNATTRMITGVQSRSITINEDVTFHVCGLELANSVTLNVADNRKVRFFVDSPERAGSPCSAQTNVGKVRFTNSIVVNRDNPASDRVTELELFVWGGGNEYPYSGRTSCGSHSGADIDFLNSIEFHGIIYAPTATFRGCNSADKMTGGIVAEHALFNNSSGLNYPNSTAIRNWTTPAARDAEQRGWFECTPAPSDVNDPESGCTR